MNVRRPAILVVVVLLLSISTACGGKKKAVESCFDTASAGTIGQLDACVVACTKYNEYPSCARIASEGRRSCVSNPAHCKQICAQTASFNVFMNTNDRIAMCGTF